MSEAEKDIQVRRNRVLKMWLAWNKFLVRTTKCSQATASANFQQMWYSLGRYKMHGVPCEMPPSPTLFDSPKVVWDEFAHTLRTAHHAFSLGQQRSGTAGGNPPGNT